MNYFGELLKEARKHARLTQQALADKVDIDDSYISKMEKGGDKPPTRDVAVKLADALGISDEEEKIRFLSAAGVVNAEDLKGFELVKIEDDEPEEEDQVSGASPPSMANPALALSESLLVTVIERFEAIIESKHYSEEETERFIAALIEAAEMISKVIRPQHSSKRGVEL